MPIRHGHASPCRHLASPLLTSGYIWISDEGLSRVLQRFFTLRRFPHHQCSTSPRFHNNGRHQKERIRPAPSHQNCPLGNTSFNAARQTRTQCCSSTLSDRSRPRGYDVSSQHTRQGSSVPGPLEARRRSTRRKMMGLSVAGAPSPVDLGTIGGMGAGCRAPAPITEAMRWQAPGHPPRGLKIFDKNLSDNHSHGYQSAGLEDNADTPWGSRKLPAWLVDSDQNSLPKNPLQHEENAHNGPYNSSSRQNPVPLTQEEGQEATVTDWHRRLHQCNELPSIRRLVEGQLEALQDTSFVSREALRHLINLDTPMDALLEFMGDGVLNHPAAGNLVQLVQAVVTGGRERGSIDGFLTWIEKQGEVGLLQDKDIFQVLDGFSMRESMEHVENSDPPAARFVRWRIHQSMWSGVRSSRVCSPKDLSVETLSAFVRVAARSPRPLEGCVMSADIFQCFQHLTRGEQVRLLHYFVQIFLDNQLGAISARFENGQHMSRFRCLGRFLVGLPLQLAIEGTTIASRTLLNRIHAAQGAEQEQAISYFERWLKALSRSNLLPVAREAFPAEWKVIETSLDMLGPRALAYYLQDLDDDERCAYLVRLWIPMEWIASRTRFVFEQRLQSDRQFTPAANDAIMGDPPTSARKLRHGGKSYQALVSAFLYADPALSSVLIPKLFPLLDSWNRRSAIRQILTFLRTRGMAIPLYLLVLMLIQYARSNPRLVISLLRDEPRPVLDMHPHLLEILVEASSTVHSFLIDLMIRDLGVKDNSVPPHAPITPARLHLLHVAAQSFARAKRLRPAEAWGSVIRILSLFTHRRDLLDCRMSYAVVMAGVTRVLQNKDLVAIDRLQLALKLVRDLEGPKAAQWLERAVIQWEAKIQARRDQLSLEKRRRRRKRKLDPYIHAVM